jgi:hypothetical protein
MHVDMKKIFFTLKIMLFFLTFNIYSQTEYNKNNIFVGSHGHAGGLYNVSYEKLIYENENENLRVLIGTGIGYRPSLKEALPSVPSKTSIPVLTKILYGNNH